MSIYLDYFIDLLIIPLYLIYIITQLFVGIYLFFKLKKKRLNNSIPLALFFILTAFEGFLGLIKVPNVIFQAIQFIPNITLLFFIQYTFYRDRKSPFKILLLTIIILKLINFTMTLFIPLSVPLSIAIPNSQLPFYYIYILIIFINIFLSELWLAYSSLSYYISIKDKSIEPWIKKRYLLLGISAVILSLEGVAWLFMPPTSTGYENLQSFLIGFSVVIVYVVFSIMSLLVWVMPQKFKDFLNKNFEVPIDGDLSEEDLISQIQSELRKEKF